MCIHFILPWSPEHEKFFKIIRLWGETASFNLPLFMFTFIQGEEIQGFVLF